MRKNTAALSVVAVLSAFTAIAGVQSCASGGRGESAREESEESEESEENEENEEEGEENEQKGGGEVAIELAQAPDAVRAAIAKLVGGAKLAALTREVDEGVTQFEAEWLVGDRECSANLSEGGEILELESQIPTAQVPAALMQALNKKFPGATVKKAETVEVHYYEFELTVDGKVRKVMASATGEMGEEEED